MPEHNEYTKKLLEIARALTKEEFLLLSKWEIGSCNGQSYSIIDIDRDVRSDIYYIECFDDFSGKTILYVLYIDGDKGNHEVYNANLGFDEYKSYRFDNIADKTYLLEWLCMGLDSEKCMHPGLKDLETRIRAAISNIDEDDRILDMEGE